MFLPALNVLRRKFNKVNITLLVANTTIAQLVKNFNVVDEILTLNPKHPLFLSKLFLKHKKYNLAILPFVSNTKRVNLYLFFSRIKIRLGHKMQTKQDLLNIHIPWNPNKHEVISNLELLKPLNIKENYKPLKLNVGEESRKFARAFLLKNKISNKDNIFVIHPSLGKEKSHKKWPIKNFALLSDILQEKYGYKVIFIEGPEEKGITNVIKKLTKNNFFVFRNKDIMNVAAIISMCKLFINVESGLGHIASLLDIPTVTIFGPSNPKRTRPYGKKNIIVRKNLKCSPCYLIPGQKIKCKNLKCLKDLKVKDVVSAIKHNKIIK